MKSRPALAIGISAILAAAVWFFSKHFTGYAEPWDGSFSYYLGGLFIVGFVSALVAPLPVWGHYVGIISGQATYMILGGGGALAVLGIGLAAIWSIFSLFGVAFAFAVRFA